MLLDAVCVIAVVKVGGRYTEMDGTCMYMLYFQTICSNMILLCHVASMVLCQIILQKPSGPLFLCA